MPGSVLKVFTSWSSIAAVMSFEHGRFAQLSWWDYHVYLLAGFGAAVCAVIVCDRRQRNVAGVLDDVPRELRVHLVD